MSAVERTRDPEEHGLSLLAQVSNEMVRIYKDQFGRGPTKARSYWCGEDVLTCILDDTLTPAEHALVALGEHQRLRDTRIFFQYATRSDFCDPIERLTGRKVRAFISGIDTEADGLALETFVLDGREAPPSLDGHGPTNNQPHPA